jgi:hypothetical protein
VTSESHQIAALLVAQLSDPFGFSIKSADGRRSRHGATTAEGDVLTIVVTDHNGRAKREYRAAIQLVAEGTRRDGLRVVVSAPMRDVRR